MVACSKASLQGPNLMPFNERLEFLEPLTKGTLACVYRATSWCANANGKIEIAVKKISKSTTTVIQWLNEERILKQLQTFNDPHIVKLLASYCTLDSYALVFPLANGNMDQLMGRNLPASNIGSTATWVVKQMQGLAKALQYLHTGDEKNKSYGRHGDINPGNILWYPAGDKGTPLSGTLKIADFGRSEFRSMSSRRPSIRKALCEGTALHCLDYADGQYTAPECEIPAGVLSDRRASDIWSLGCVFLDLLVWSLEGANERTRLHQKLRSDVPGRGMSYWHLEVTTHQLLFSLKPPIREYLERLSEFTKDNAKLRAAVDLLIYGSVLDPNPHERPTAKQLGEQLSGIEIQTLQAQTVTKRPVWTRFWTYTPGYASHSQQTMPPYDYDSKSVPGTLFLPYPDMASDEAFHEVPSNIDSQHVHDMNDDLLLHDYDDALGYRCDQNLDSKRTCPYCTLEARPVALKAHARAVHRNRQIIECPDCKELFADTKQLKRHQWRLGLACANASILDGKDYLGREPLLLPRLPRTDSATSLRGPHVSDDNSSGRSSAAGTEYPTKMYSGGLTRSYHHDDAGGPYVE
jgi:serine/threonine protein kinase